MECPSCYELFNEEKRIPRNLPCGHTYCQFCLENLATHGTTNSCPTCKKPVGMALFNPELLPKNYLALEYVRKFEEDRKGNMMCDTHLKEQLMLFCKTCEHGICKQCIINHSGHQFVKIDSELMKVRHKIQNIKKMLNSNDLQQDDQMGHLQGLLRKAKKREKKTTETIESAFTAFEELLQEREEAVHQEYKTETMAEQERLYDLKGKVEDEDKELSDHSKRLAELKAIASKPTTEKQMTDDEILGEVKSIRNEIRNFHINPLEVEVMSYSVPEFIMQEKAVLEFIKSIGALTAVKSDARPILQPKLNLFGDKNKILSWDLDQKSWSLSTLDIPHPINYYAAAVTLPDGSAFITGGGSSPATYVVTHEQKCLPKAPLRQVRKEHSAVYMGGYVWVMGGYDNVNNRFLKSCEKYDYKTNTWSFFKNMNTPRCAFSSCTLNDKMIYIFGGYDGINRLDDIDVYDPDVDLWTVLDIALNTSLSNCACFSPCENKIIVLGGGHSNGFSRDVKMIDFETLTWTTLPELPDGKDLRNKITFHDGIAYAVGGNNYRTDAYSFVNQEWLELPIYPIEDNLDSWSSALTYLVSKDKSTDSSDDDEEEVVVSDEGSKTE